MPDSTKGSDSGLLRQRRSLILVSALIYFLSISGATITKDITVLNVTLAISHIHHIYLTLWLVWWWFFYRYYQYYKQEGSLKVKDEVNRQLTSSIEQRLNRLMKSEQPGKSSSEDGYRHCQTVRRDSAFRICAQIGIQIHSRGGGHSVKHDWEEIEIPFYWKDLVATYYDFFMRRSEFTDYLFPIFFAITAFIYAYFFSDWDGSFCKLIAQ